MPQVRSESRGTPGWRFLTWVALVGSLFVVILQPLRPGPLDAIGYFAMAAFGLAAIRAAYDLIRNVRPDA